MTKIFLYIPSRDSQGWLRSKEPQTRAAPRELIADLITSYSSTVLGHTAPYIFDMPEKFAFLKMKEEKVGTLQHAEALPQYINLFVVHSWALEHKELQRCWNVCHGVKTW